MHMIWYKKSQTIYLDYAATTPLDTDIAQEMLLLQKSGPMNPSSVHDSGKGAKAILNEARKRCQEALSTKNEDKIIFTSGGTESNNLAIKGVLENYSDGTIITTPFEHLSVLNTINEYADQGFKILSLPIGLDGVVNLEQSKKVISQATGVRLASIMYVQNEIGTVQPIKEITKYIKMSHPDALMHTDASQAPLYKNISTQSLGVDLLTLCGHKLYGPQGVGLLWVKGNVELSQVMSGGSQQEGMRAGSEPVALIHGLSLALEQADKLRSGYTTKMQELKDYFLDSILGDNVVLNSDPRETLALALNISFLDTTKSSEELVSFFNTHGVEVSSKSACMGSSIQESYVLDVCGHKRPNSIRFSFGRHTTKKDINSLSRIIKAL